MGAAAASQLGLATTTTASDYRAIGASLRAKWPESPETVTASCVPRAEGLQDVVAGMTAYPAALEPIPDSRAVNTLGSDADARHSA